MDRYAIARFHALPEEEQAMQRYQQMKKAIEEKEEKEAREAPMDGYPPQIDLLTGEVYRAPLNRARWQEMNPRSR